MSKWQISLLSSDEAEQACRLITSSLPEWLGRAEANEQYALGVRDRTSFAISIEGQYAGMMSLEFPFPQNSNLYWVGVKREYHGLGIGSALLKHAEAYCLQRGCLTLTVETRSPKEDDPNDLIKYRFYQKAGFYPLFELRSYGTDFLMVYLQKHIGIASFKWIDMTHVLLNEIPTWDGSCGFNHEAIVDHDDSSSDCRFLVQKIGMLAGAGTHMDAPVHCFPNGLTIDQIPLTSLIAPCVVIDLSRFMHERYQIDVPEIEQFEKEYGSIQKGTFVIFHTGWEKFWIDPARYRNNLVFPTISQQAAEYLISKDIAGIGIDTLSPDRSNEGYPVHRLFLGVGKYIVENVAHAKQMAANGGYALVLPIKFSEGAEAPIRLIGMIP